MTRIVLYLLAASVYSSCSLSQQETKELSPIVQKAKETSLYTDAIDWTKVNAEYLRLTKGKNTVADKMDGYQFLLNSLGDPHASLRSVEDYSILVSYDGEIKSKDKRKRDGEFMKTVINSPNATFSAQDIDEEIGILKIIGIGPGDVKKQADEIRKGLLDLKEKGISKWIVDLRYNGGGNIDPMISGIAPLIGEGYIGGSAYLDKEMAREYRIENAQFYNYGRLACEMSNEPKINPDEKVVVLLSKYTISSGEMLAVAFKGRPNTRFIGEYSGGLTTGTGFDLIEDEVYLVIAQDIFCDRNKNVYNEHVDVDESIAFDHTATLELDKQIQRAIEWLNEE